MRLPEVITSIALKIKHQLVLFLEGRPAKKNLPHEDVCNDIHAKEHPDEPQQIDDSERRSWHRGHSRQKDETNQNRNRFRMALK